MQDAKHLFASKTFWLHVITLASAIAATCQGDEWIAQHPGWMQFLLYFSAFAGVVLRMLTDKPVTVKTGGNSKPPMILLAVAACLFCTSSALGYEPQDALAEVNAARRASGLRPFLRDNGLTRAAKGCAKYRADRLMEGHTRDDLSFVPASTMALIPVGPGGWLRISGGCGASGGPWATCCTFDREWTYAGAAFCWGPDRRRYMQLFVR